MKYDHLQLCAESIIDGFEGFSNQLERSVDYATLKKNLSACNQKMKLFAKEFGTSNEIYKKFERLHHEFELVLEKKKQSPAYSAPSSTQCYSTETPIMNLATSENLEAVSTQIKVLKNLAEIASKLTKKDLNFQYENNFFFVNEGMDLLKVLVGENDATYKSLMSSKDRLRLMLSNQKKAAELYY